MKKLIRYIPNAITITRLLLALSLIFFEHKTLPFLIIYGIAGISDVLDGVLARKFNVISRFGSVLDTLCDFTLYIIMAIKIFPFMQETFPLVITILVLTCFGIRFISYMICFIKFKKFASIHTYANKAIGFVVFVLPYSYLLPNLGIIIYLSIGVAIALYGTTEECLIHLFSKRYSEKNKTIFHVFKNNKKEDEPLYEQAE